jgi:hypothetical protein
MFLNGLRIFTLTHLSPLRCGVVRACMLKAHSSTQNHGERECYGMIAEN